MISIFIYTESWWRVWFWKRCVRFPFPMFITTYAECWPSSHASAKTQVCTRKTKIIVIIITMRPLISLAKRCRWWMTSSISKGWHASNITSFVMCDFLTLGKLEGWLLLFIEQIEPKNGRKEMDWLTLPIPELDAACQLCIRRSL